jgi:hypothetical protein
MKGLNYRMDRQHEELVARPTHASIAPTLSWW